ncbi:hypothetical protein ABT297_32760 [Dactylosporangium sp. NPDC000555]|uniref:hypothetical protein n=1 Tax=Dactylosporangium sp. NPDC000555 TaxID=3154260 RepID=UPI003321D446
MTRYAVDETRGELVAIWDTGYGAVAITVANLPVDLGSRERLALAANLSGLSDALWRCYTHPASAADSLDENTEGWRRQLTREGFATVADHVREPNLPSDNGALLVSYDPVEECAHRVGRALHAASDAGLRAAVVAEVEAEVEAVEKAELGDLSGRSTQAVQLTRQDASPVQVAAADEILARDPLGADDLFLDLDPTSACVAAVHWLKAAADVASRVSGRAASQVVLEADNIEAIPVRTPTDVLELLDVDYSPTDIVTAMIRDAMAIAAGQVPDVDVLRDRLDEAEELADEHTTDEFSAQELRKIRLTPLDPQRPARDMLEDLLTGIHGCWLLYNEYADHSDVDLDDEVDEKLDDLHEQMQTEFSNAVREEARAHRYRLGLEPAPHRPTRPALRLVASDDDGDGEDEERRDIDLEAEDSCEQVVSAVLDAGDPDIPRDLIESMLQVADDDIGRVIAALIARGVGYLVAMKDGPLVTADLDAAMEWLGERYGAEYAGPALAAASLAGHYASQRMLAERLGVDDVTFGQLSDVLGPDLFPAIVWLCAALVSTVGEGDIGWLLRYRPTRED